MDIKTNTPFSDTEILSWEDFVSKYKNKEISASVDLKIAHELMKSEFAPKEWRVTIKIFDLIIIALFVFTIYVFFKYTWYFGIILFGICYAIIKAVRKTTAQEVINLSLKNYENYFIAVSHGALKLKNKD